MSRRPTSLQGRLALGIGLLVVLLWGFASYRTLLILTDETDEVFDSALQETAQRILPLAAFEIFGRDDEDEGTLEHLAPIGEHEEYFTYLVRDSEGHLLFQSHDADPEIFPAYQGRGFAQTKAYRFYSDEVFRGQLTITVAEPMEHRHEVIREMSAALMLPLLAVIPLAFLGIIFAVRRSLAPLRRLRERLLQRGANDLSPLPHDPAMPAETAPVVDALNDLLARLTKTFEAERSFAANAAHELRTPLAGAIAQVQRLEAETQDPVAQKRSKDIERTLKRLTLLSERLMQLARAEGSRLRVEKSMDMRPILRLVTEDLQRIYPDAPISLSVPKTAVMSDIDPDAFGILCRNLVDNALKHGSAEGEIIINLSPEGELTVSNDCPAVAPEVLARLTERFERNDGAGDGSGLGLAIVRTISERSGGQFRLLSPSPGREGGFTASYTLPPLDKAKSAG